MKKAVKSLVIIAAVVVSTPTVSNAQSTKKDVKESSITWKGKKILGSHTGTIDLKEGHLEMDGTKLTGGIFVVNMTTIVDTDLEGSSKTKLENHLRSADFFDVENHPTSTLTIKNATLNGNTYEVNADLTIKGITKPVVFDLEMGASGARASVKVDRTKYDIRFGSGNFADSLADNTISNNFELDVILKF
ncbi:polyisoprenoid-binding protein YceI [Ulvibacter sp. MAR_2010_11]|uniref:YceI family protein n=1 Tax=Ulvibacter sp. MAR_2010_11 TaxID=1250229 RepID=UPI000C2BA80D|nr:YceI family protein [Ulvibacter sp. MAR_2010_11]PKA83580.1 polyisoprenoid-binding protein YceI [Ulvibacter sp. MAR_2010_11]